MSNVNVKCPPQFHRIPHQISSPSSLQVHPLCRVMSAHTESPMSMASSRARLWVPWAAPPSTIMWPVVAPAWSKEAVSSASHLPTWQYRIRKSLPLALSPSFSLSAIWCANQGVCSASISNRYPTTSAQGTRRCNGDQCGCQYQHTWRDCDRRW